MKQLMNAWLKDEYDELPNRESDFKARSMRIINLPAQEFAQTKTEQIEVDSESKEQSVSHPQSKDLKHNKISGFHTVARRSLYSNNSRAKEVTMETTM